MSISKSRNFQAKGFNACIIFISKKAKNTINIKYSLVVFSSFVSAIR